MEFFARLLLEGATLIGLPETAFCYRRHGDSATARQTRSLHRFVEEAAIYDQLGQLGVERGYPALAAAGANKRIIRLNLLYCLLCDLCRLRLGNARAKWDLLRRLFRQSPSDCHPDSAAQPTPPPLDRFPEHV